MLSGELKIPFTDEELVQWEVKLGYAKGQLARSSNFWKNYYVALGRETKFDTSIPKFEFDLAILKESKRIAKNYAEAAINSYAEYVIHDEEQVAKVSNVARKDVKKAWAVLDKLSIEDMKKVLFQLGIDNKHLSNEVVEDKLSSLLEADPKRFITVATDPDLELKDNIKQAVSAGILEFRGQVYSYGTTSFGELDEAVKMLKTKEYAETLASILKQLNVANNRI